MLAAIAVVTSVLGASARTAARARSLASALCAAVVAQTIVGDVIYPAYLERAKPVLKTLAAGSRSLAEAFDVKEHLAFLALAGALGVFVLTRTAPKPTALVRTLFGCTHAAIVVVAILGIVVASVKTP